MDSTPLATSRTRSAIASQRPSGLARSNLDADFCPMLRLTRYDCPRTLNSNSTCIACEPCDINWRTCVPTRGTWP